MYISSVHKCSLAVCWCAAYIYNCITLLPFSSLSLSLSHCVYRPSEGAGKLDPRPLEGRERWDSGNSCTGHQICAKVKVSTCNEVASESPPCANLSFATFQGTLLKKFGGRLEVTCPNVRRDPQILLFVPLIINLHPSSFPPSLLPPGPFPPPSPPPHHRIILLAYIPSPVLPPL